MNHREIISWGQKKILAKSLITRQTPSINLLTLGKIICFLGGRRVGKTSLMFQLAQQYIHEGIYTSDRIIHLDFTELDHANLSLVDIHHEYHDRKPLYILDEIQELPDFEKQLTWLYNQGATIFISGSNSHLLGQEISTKLRGRVYDIMVTGLSFEEFLAFSGQEQINSGGEMDILFEDYLMWGGYPEVVLQSDPEAKISLLRSYLDIMIYKDLIDRYHIKNESILRHLIKSLTLFHTKHVNIHKLFNTYKSLGFSVSKNTLYEYLGYLQNTFFVSTLSHAYKKSYGDKIYIIDNGYMNLYSKESNRGQKFEHIIYTYLKKNHHYLGYSDTPTEVDFTDTNEQRQVCYQITEENYLREIACAKTLPTTIIVGQKSPLIPASITQLRYDDFLLPH